jgi:hypothetical protein
VYKLGECYYYPLSPSITGIPAKAGIRCSKITSPQTKSDLSDYV